MNQDEIKKYVESLLYTKNWKNYAITGITCLVVLVLLNSILFSIIIGLVKMGLFLGGIASLVYAAFLAYPDVMDKLNK